MQLIEWATSPWGEQVPIHIGWVLIWVVAFAGLAFLVAHAVWVGFFAKKQEFVEPEVSPDFEARLPAKVKKHSLTSRVFHWIMAASMLVLLFTAFLPLVGNQSSVSQLRLEEIEVFVLGSTEAPDGVAFNDHYGGCQLLQRQTDHRGRNRVVEIAKASDTCLI